MRSNIQKTVQRVFGNLSVRANGLQMVATFLHGSLMSCLIYWLTSFSTRLSGRVMTRMTFAVAVKNRGYDGHRADQLDSPGAVGEKPGPGFDLASRVGWIAG